MPVCISELYPPNNFTTTPLLSPYDGFAYTNNTVIDDVLFVVFQIDCDNVLVNITCTVNDSSTGSVTVNIGETSSVTLVNSDTPLNINFLLNTGDTVSISFLSGNYTADDIFGEVKILVDGPTPTPTASVTLSPTPTASATLTPTPTPTATPLPTFACSNSLLFLWGDNQYGQLGDNTTIHRSSPVQTIFGGSNWCKHSSGGKHSVGFKNDNSLWSWGRNNQGQLGLNDVINRSSPVQIASALWIDVSAGYDFTSVLKNDGTLWSWGNNTSYQLGDGTLISKSSMVQAIHDADFVSISCGFDHGGAIDVTGRLFCWGSNEFGQCGQNQNTNDVQSPTQTVAGGNQWQKVSCGKYFTLGLKTDYTIWGWGKNTDGQFGNYSVVSVSSPIQVSNILWKNLTAGTDFGAAICYGFPPTPTPTLTPTPTPTKTPKPVVPGKLYEWGDNEFGQLGDNTTISRSAIKEVAGDGSTWTAIDAGGEQIIGLKTDGTIHLWGHNDQGQLGNNNTINRSSPLLLNSDTTYWTSVSMGSKFGSAIGIPRPSPTVTPGPTPSPTPIPGYRLYGWGDNASGLMGNNSVVTSITPIAVGVENTWTNITGKYRTAGGIKTDGSLWLWGFNSQGQLGNNSTVHRSSPVQTISAGTDWEAVSIGYSHTLAIKKDGSLWSWGFGLYGELGIGTSFTSIVSSPVQVANMNSYVTKVAAGDSISFAIKQGKMFAWGFNGYGRLGTGSTELIITSPVQTADNSSNWVDVACGDTSVLGIKSDGTLWSWGLNLYGCLGLNDVLHRSSPVQIGTDNSWSKISMSTHAAGIKNDGTLWLWGDNRFGQIGDSTSDNRSSPVQTTTVGTNWQSVSLALPYSTAIKKDGSYWVWGPGTQYTLGTGGTNSASYPIQTYLNDNNWAQSSATLYGVAFGLRTI